MNKTLNYDLEERTAVFGENVIHFCQPIKYNVITDPIIKQIIRSSTSIGANYMEANGACSKNDFRNKIFICKKEAQETKHWLRMLIAAMPEKETELKILLNEAHELTLIFHAIANSSKK